MHKLPQRLVNVRVRDRGALGRAPSSLNAGVELAAQELAGRGRVLVRPSGTEPLVRVMVEAPTERGGRGRLRAPGRRSSSASSHSRPDRPGALAGAVIVARRCAASSATSAGAPPVSSCWPVSAGSSTAAMTPPGISVITAERIEAVRAVGNLSALRAKLADGLPGGAGAAAAVAVAERPPGTGIGHTRWATHGRVSEQNAHPHFDSADRVHVVVNGIVENYVELKERLAGAGSVFSSETDAEVIAHLIADLYEGDLAAAVRAAYAQLEGHFAFVAMSFDEPEVLVGARRECPLVVGRGEGEQFIASAVPAFLDADPPRAVRRERRDRRAARRRASRSRPPPASPWSGTSRASTGTRRPPRRAATRRSC